MLFVSWIFKNRKGSKVHSLTNIRYTKESLHVFIFLQYQKMSKKLFVGNIDWGTTDDQLKEAFEKYGEVEEAIIIKDKFSNRSKGFGFVTFPKDEEADQAMSELNESELNGRKIIVNEARPQQPRD